MKTKLYYRIKLLAVCGGLLAMTGCAVYPLGAGPGYGGRGYDHDRGGPSYDRGYHERRDWGDDDGRRR